MAIVQPELIKSMRKYFQTLDWLFKKDFLYWEEEMEKFKKLKLNKKYFLYCEEDMEKLKKLKINLIKDIENIYSSLKEMDEDQEEGEDLEELLENLSEQELKNNIIEQMENINLFLNQN